MSDWDSLVARNQTEEQETQAAATETHSSETREQAAEEQSQHTQQAEQKAAPQDESASAENASSDGSGEDMNMEEFEKQIVNAIRTCYDPEIPVNIYELGLIYNIDVNPDTKHVDVDMTLTSPMCPVAGTLPLEVEDKVRTVEGVASAKVEVVWDPPWTPDMMSEAAKVDLGFDL